MGILDDLIAGGRREEEYKDFVTRYEQGKPADGYSDQEVLEKYSDVAHAVPADEYAQAAQDALKKLTPQEREALLRLLEERARNNGVPLPAKVDSDPQGLGGLLTELHKIPGRLRDLLGGNGSATSSDSASRPNILASPIAKAALAGITAMVVSRVMHGARGGRR